MESIDEALLGLLAIQRISGFQNTKILSEIAEATAEGCLQDLLSQLLRRVPVQELSVCKRELELAAQSGIEAISIAENRYPQSLAAIADPPLLLFLKGKLPPVSDAYAIVGSRNATDYGLRVAHTLARAIAASGMTVVSGLAFGIDAESHRGAVAGALARGTHPGIAVLGSGHLHIGPKENRSLAHQLLDAGGAIVSEYGMAEPARRHYFPRRNRIISGLSTAVIVVEAADKSGSLITARLAAEQGREVYSVPGPIDSPQSVGTNRLIQEGARALTAEDKLLTVAKTQTPRSRTSPPAVDDPLAPVVLKQFRERPLISFEALCCSTQLLPTQLLPILTTLEIAGIITSLPGQNYRLLELFDT